MAANPLLWFIFMFSSGFCFAMAKEVHIVYMGDTGDFLPAEVTDFHHSLLTQALGSEEAGIESIIYSYKHSFNGFAALLSEDEAAAISEMPGVVSVFPSRARSLDTTRTWDFLGLESGIPLFSRMDEDLYPNLWEKAKYGKDVIIGLLDTGIWPESRSFNDDDLGPIPSHWKGTCVSGEMFNSSTCNRKVIGARYYIKGYEKKYGKLNASGEYLSARDADGHGTHTSSTAAGAFASGANVFGFGNGTAKGGAPMARIAMYKVCWPIPSGEHKGDDTCFEEDMLAALDDAVKDGVHVISMSIGSPNPQPDYFSDAIAVGSFHAVKKGIVVSCSAGNSGPTPSTVGNLAPWIITVAASSLDRDFPSNVLLGNGTVLNGKSITPLKLKDEWYPFFFAGNAALSSNITNASQCLPNSLDSTKVKGKVVLCLRGQGTRVGKSQEVLRAGAAGYVLGNSAAQGSEVSVDAYLLPGTAINANNAVAALFYINSTKEPMVKIVPPVTLLGFKPAPSMAAFSSQGPNSLNPGILKPDISAPGLNILAAWTGGNSPTKLPNDTRRVEYNIISGTSMSCPHVAGVTALLKSVYPKWSPAAIKSAIMTTASTLNNMQEPILNASGIEAGPFNYGSGEINPTAASDPGLVYDTTTEDYLLFLCKVGYNASTISNNTRIKHFTCPTNIPDISNLNYPSIAITNLTDYQVVPRTVTNVGSKNATYNVTIKNPPGILVDIQPRTLGFKTNGETQSFSVSFKVQEKCYNGSYVFGSYTWSDGHHLVRSPLAILTSCHV